MSKRVLNDERPLEILLTALIYAAIKNLDETLSIMQLNGLST